MAEDTKPEDKGGFDFADVQVQKTIDEGDGAWMHIQHPATGALLYDGDDETKPCRVKVLSVDSKRYAKATRALDNKLIRNRGKVNLEEASKDVLVRAAAAIIGFENVRFQGRALDAKNKEDRLLWVGLAPNFVTQVQAFAAEVDHFFGLGSGS